MTVTPFTGGRTGPTLKDEENFCRHADELCADLKEPEVLAYVAARIVYKNGKHTIHPEWSKKPGCGLHELIGAAQLIVSDLTAAMPDEGKDAG